MKTYLTSSSVPTYLMGLFFIILTLNPSSNLAAQALKQPLTHKAKQPSPTIRVLCIDGGGVRGIIPARILQELEQQSGKPIHELFDLIVGTSTGGIISLALTMPYPEQPQKAMYAAKDLVQFYLEQSSRIFHASIWRKLYTGFGLWGAQYDRKHLDEILKKFMQDVKLSQALCPVGVVSYSLEKQQPHIWTSYIAQKDTSKDYYMRDLAGATSAAPYYFAPKEIDLRQGKEHLTEVDGGIYANNPAVAAIFLVAHLYPDFCRQQLVLVSLGTGKAEKVAHLDGFDLIHVPALINDMMNANGDLLDSTLEAILPYYYGFQLRLPKDLMAMDKGDKKHLGKLLVHAEQLIKERKQDIATLVEKLTK